MKKGKLIWATGVSHCGGTGYLKEKFLPLCEKKRKKVKIIYPGEMLFDAPGIALEKDNVLNAPEDHLSVKMKWVFERIKGEVDATLEDFDAIIIKGHKIFRWNRSFIFAHAPEYALMFRPDMMFTFVDGVVPILERLGKGSRFDGQGYTKRDICDWQQLEVDGTKEWADTIHSPHFVIPSTETPELLYQLIFDEEPELVYVAIDITHSPELKGQVDRFVAGLRKYFPALINPYTVPFDYSERDPAEERHVVNMCLNWFVPQSKIAVGYYPVVGASQGKPHELGKAFIMTKHVWVVYIPKETNLFVESFKTRPVFRTEKEFFEFLKNRKK
ncbi:MAG: hypothetical protein ABII97_01220 [Patescibacteria group bacterium]